MNLKSLSSIKKNLYQFNADRSKGVSEASGDGAARDPKSTQVKIVTPRLGGGPAGGFEDSPIDLSEVGRAYYTDSYISRAINKVVGLMFKSGWQFSSLNADALDYVQARFNLMSESTDTSTEELLRELGNNYVLYGNAPVIKVRGSENLADLEATGYYGGEPIAALFAGPPESFQVERDELGNITNYNVMGEQGEDVAFSPEDVHHMTYHKPTGRAFGIPHISNVIDDVLILRQIEENIARLIYRNIFPLQTYTVGESKPGYEATDDEIIQVQETLRNAPLDAMIVLPERHKIETVSNSSGALQAYEYLRYFRQRVFTGLGVSESTMGIGDSSNRSTSDNQSSDLIDLVKDFQQNFTAEFQRVIDEILFEGGYDPTLNKEEKVLFEFIEIEQSAKIARENHNIQMFHGNAISFEELRSLNGHEPITDLNMFYYNLFKNDAARAGEASDNQTNNRDQPENQHGKEDAPNKDSLKDSMEKETNIKKVVEKSNSRLTPEEQAVKFALDNEIKVSSANKLKDSWRKLKELLIEDFDNIKASNRLPSLIESYFSDDLFQTDFEKKEFVRILDALLQKKMTHETVREFDDSTYLYEESVLLYYVRSLQYHTEGGM